MLCTFGMAVVSPAMTILTLDLYPARRGLAASLQSAFVMAAFSIYSGLLAPLLFGNAFKLACGVLVGHLASVAFWFCGQRCRRLQSCRMSGTPTRAFGSVPRLLIRPAPYRSQ